MSVLSLLFLFSCLTSAHSLYHTVMLCVLIHACYHTANIVDLQAYIALRKHCELVDLQFSVWYMIRNPSKNEALGTLTGCTHVGVLT